MSIRLRLTLWSAALFGLALALFAALVYGAASRQLTSQLDYAIHLQALDASRKLHTVSLTQPEPPSHRLQLSALATLADKRLFVQLVDPNGRVHATSDNLRQPFATPPASRQSALNGEEAHTMLRLPDERLEIYSTAVLLDDQYLGVLQVAASLQPLESSLARLRLFLGVIVLGAAATAAGLGWLIVTKALHPVDRMTQSAQIIGASADFQQRLPVPGQRDELSRLATTFNDMLAQLERAFATQRHFLADASHELRTPLAAIRTNIAALLRGVVNDPRERDDSLRAMAREADRMGRLVADLLLLARADAGQPLGHQRIALDTLLVEAYHQAKALADGVALVIGELEQIEITGDPDRLKQLMLNLLDNALRYTPAPGTVTLELIQRNRWVIMRVHDTGPGIPAEQLPHIFERFYRGDQPHAQSRGGTGLGLAICKWIVEAHGGRITVASRAGIGSTFTIYLPARDGRDDVTAPAASASRVSAI